MSRRALAEYEANKQKATRESEVKETKSTEAGATKADKATEAKAAEVKSSEPAKNTSSINDEIIKKLAELAELQGKQIVEHSEAINELDRRVTAMEESVADLRCRPRSKPQPAKSEPQPAKSEPQPAKSEPQPAKFEPQPAKSEPQPAKSEPQPAKSGNTVKYKLSDGPREMYKYWDYRYGCWRGPKMDLFAAKAAGNGFWEPIWVWIKDGQLDHVLNTEEIEKYCP